MRSTSINEVLFTKTQQKVLGLLYGRPEETFYMNEIVRIAGIGKGTIKRELERMHSAGLLTVKRIGNQKHHQANQECPIYDELLGIVRKTFGVADVVRQALSSLEKAIDIAFIYGSVARGVDTASSDIDLLVVTDSIAYADLMSVLVTAEQSLGKPINPTIYDKAQIKKKLRAKNAFIVKIFKQPKIWIKGTEDVIEEIR